MLFFFDFFSAAKTVWLDINLQFEANYYFQMKVESQHYIDEKLKKQHHQKTDFKFFVSVKNSKCTRNDIQF